MESIPKTFNEPSDVILLHRSKIILVQTQNDATSHENNKLRILNTQPVMAGFLWPVSSALLLLLSGIHTVFDLNWEEKKHLSSTSHTDTSMTYCQSITQTLRIIWVKCIPLSLRSKTRRSTTPPLPTWIYSCRSRVTVSCAPPFTTNVTISTSISQTFLSWVAIFHLRQPMVFFLTAHTVCQGMFLLWMFYSKGSATFI